jgi:type VI protein secretion system component VasF
VLLHILSGVGQLLLGLGLFWAVVALGASGRMRSSAKAGGALSAAMTQIDEILSATKKTAHEQRIQAEDGREAQEDDSGDGPDPGAT